MTAGAATELHGTCHCGALAGTFYSGNSAEQIQLRACSCSFCRRHGAATFSDPSGQFVLHSSPNNIRTYTFGQGVAETILCRQCGVYVCMLMKNDVGGLLATINAIGLGFGGFSCQTPTRVDYLTETAEQKRARRLQMWTPTRMQTLV